MAALNGRRTCHDGAVLNDLRLFDDHGLEVPASFQHTSDVDGTTSTHRVSFSVDAPIRAGRVTARLDGTIHQMIEHGFQSWSTVRRCVPTDVRPERSEAPRWFRGQMLADRESAGREVAGETFLVHDRGVVGFLSARHSFTRVRVDSHGGLEAQWLLDQIELRPAQQYSLDDLFTGQGPPGAMYSHYAELSGRSMFARRSERSPRVWCSWYQYFDQVTPNDIRENLELARQHGIEVVQIDDGWQREIGVWTQVNERWAEPLEVLASEIRSAGITPGIWTAPFLAIENGEIAREYPEWLVRNDHGEPTTALHHGGWGGKIFALDLTHPAVLAHLESTYRELSRAGFDYFKIDFCHAGAAVGHRLSTTHTRAEALRFGFEAVRRGIGDDAFLVGCGAPLLSAVGVVDAMRVSEDVAPYYEPRLFFPGFPEATVAARNAIEASLLRAPLHARWFTLDPDCVLLRSSETELTPHEREMVSAAALASSGFVVLSDRMALYGDEQWRVAQDLFARASHGPRTLSDPFADDLEVTWDGHRAVFNWERRTFEIYE